MATLSMGGADLTCSSGNWADAPSGTIIQVKHVYHTQTAQVTSTGTASELDTDLRLAFTPRMSNSILYFIKISSKTNWILSYYKTFQFGLNSEFILSKKH